jgi:hypothetical protein
MGLLVGSVLSGNQRLHWWPDFTLRQTRRHYTLFGQSVKVICFKNLMLILTGAANRSMIALLFS